MNIHVGDTVRLKRDIHRLPNPTNAEEKKLWANTRYSYFTHCMFDIPSVRPPWAVMQRYGEVGEIGVIEEMFKLENWHVKVRVAEELKTFRLTSVEKIKNE